MCWYLELVIATKILYMWLTRLFEYLSKLSWASQAYVAGVGLDKWTTL